MGTISCLQPTYVQCAHTQTNDKSNLNGWPRMAGIPGRRANGDKVFFFFSSISLMVYPAHALNTPSFIPFSRSQQSVCHHCSRFSPPEKKPKKQPTRLPAQFNISDKKILTFLLRRIPMPGSFVICNNNSYYSNHKQLLGNTANSDKGRHAHVCPSVFGNP